MLRIGCPRGRRWVELKGTEAISAQGRCRPSFSKRTPRQAKRDTRRLSTIPAKGVSLMKAALFALVVTACLGADEPTDSKPMRKPHPLAPSLPQLTSEEEDKLDDVI